MPRPPRLIHASLHYHVIARFNNRAFRFETDEDFRIYFSFLHLIQKKHRFLLFNYELMHSHVHLFLQPGPHISLSKTMQLIHWKYALDYNKRKNRQGHLWMDRYVSIPVESDVYALALMRYMNRNPIRAGLVENAGEWTWSGYSFYGKGEENELLSAHPSYLALSEDKLQRRQEYRLFVEAILNENDTRDNRFSEGPYIGSAEFGERLLKKK